MAADEYIEVSTALIVPRAELLFRATRSGGAGGQHVNTSSTRIELVWDVAGSPSLDDHQRVYLMKRLATRLDSQGQLRLVSQDERSQLRNREAAVERFIGIVAQALIVPKVRKRTRPSKAARRARLDDKKKRSATKRDRRRPLED